MPNEWKCYACKEIKPAECFTRDASRRGPRTVSGKCKACLKAYNDRRHKTNPNVRSEQGKLYYAAHKDEHLARMAEWRRNNSDRMLQYWHNYKAKLRDNGTYDADINITGLIDRDNGICQICHKPCLESPSIDHIKPVSKGGTHTWDNVQLAHLSCNIRKGASYANNVNEDLRSRDGA